MSGTQQRAAAGRPGRPRRGYTLVEMLVVVFIIALLAGITVPNFVRSLKTQRLRTAARTVVTAHKYARNMAVLRQSPMAIIFNGGAGDVEVQSIRDRFRLPASSMFLDRQDGGAAAAPAEGGLAGPEGTNAPPPAESEQEFVKNFGQDVTIEELELKTEDAKPSEDGVYIVLYHPNGMSDGFRIRLSDGNRRYATVETDPLSGDVETEFNFAR